MMDMPIDAPQSPEDRQTWWGVRFLKKLYVQVIIAVAVGSLLGHFEPQIAQQLKPLGDVFIRAIKLIVTPIIFLTIVVGIATMGDMRRIASVGLKALIYFEVASTIALVIGMVVGNLWPVGQGINADPASLDSSAVSGYVTSAKSMTLVEFLVNIIPTTFVEPFVKGEILPVLFVAVLFGLALCKFGDKVKPLVAILEQASAGLFGMVGIIMRFAPIGAFGAMAFTIGKYGLGTLLDLGELVLAVYIVSILFVVIILGGFLKIAGFSLWRVLSYFKDEILVVFAATSAETMIPRSIQKLERLGVKKDVVGLVMPTGFSFNMDGTAIYMTMATLFIAHATNIELSFGQQLTILFIMLFTSKGAAGVTGGGFIALAATLPTIGVLPMAGLTLLIGVDRFMAEIRAATNLTSNIIATLVVGRWVGAVDMGRANDMLARGSDADAAAEREVEAEADRANRPVEPLRPVNVATA